MVGQAAGLTVQGRVDPFVRVGRRDGVDGPASVVASPAEAVGVSSPRLSAVLPVEQGPGFGHLGTIPQVVAGVAQVAFDVVGGLAVAGVLDDVEDAFVGRGVLLADQGCGLRVLSGRQRFHVSLRPGAVSAFLDVRGVETFDEEVDESDVGVEVGDVGKGEDVGVPAAVVPAVDVLARVLGDVVQCSSCDVAVSCWKEDGVVLGQQAFEVGRVGVGSRPGGVVGGAGLDLLQVPEGEGLLQLRPFCSEVG